MKKWRMIRRLGSAFTLLVTLAGVGGVGVSTAPPATAALADLVPNLVSGVSDSLLSPMASDALAASQPTDLIPVIVTTAKVAGASDEVFARAKGAIVTRRFTNLSGYAAMVPASQLVELSRLPNISRVTYDDRIQVLNDLNYPTVGADLVKQAYGLTGNGVTVAVLDSGIAPHPDIGSREVAEVEIVGHEQGFADYFGHGTHVAGIIAGNGSSSSASTSFRRFNGIAPQAKLVAVRVLGADGTGLVSDVMAGIDWVITNRSLYKIRVLNISLGHAIDQSYAQDPLCQAVERAWKAGIVVVVSAGNMGELGYGTVVSPGNDPYVITVGASNNYWSRNRSDDILTTYTSRGPTALDHFVKPDLVAPGNRTVSLRAKGSTLDVAHPELRVKGAYYSSDPKLATADSPYFELSGSSMATAVVSGMAALMIQSDPTLTPDTVKARLMKSAEKRLEYDIFSEGAGFADLYAAMKVGGTATAPTLSPQATKTLLGIAIQNTGTLWGNLLAWVDTAIWGSNPLRGTDVVTSDSAVWGGNRTSSATSVGPNGAIWGGNNRPPRQ